MNAFAATVFSLLLFACSAPEAVVTPQCPSAQAERVIPEKMNARFKDPAMNPLDFVDRFEGESREISIHREAISAALSFTSSMHVADIGAGTGLFLPFLTAAVGDSGKVYAVDISPRFVEYMQVRVAAADMTQVEVVTCTETSTALAENSIDRAFICDTYHHFSYPQQTMQSLHQALRARGEVVIVDFERIPGVSREWILGHVRASKEEVILEIESYGFTLLKEVKNLGLNENYFLVFQKR